MGSRLTLVAIAWCTLVAIGFNFFPRPHSDLEAILGDNEVVSHLVGHRLNFSPQTNHMEVVYVGSYCQCVDDSNIFASNVSRLRLPVTILSPTWRATGADHLRPRIIVDANHTIMPAAMYERGPFWMLVGLDGTVVKVMHDGRVRDPDEAEDRLLNGVTPS